jgi:hypothetical protein
MKPKSKTVQVVKSGAQVGYLSQTSFKKKSRASLQYL